MPIYEYRCDSCGFQKEFIQRMSDALLTVCPQCEKATFSKMVTAAGFQLKGGGWYVTDFKGGGNTATGAAKKTEEKQTDSGGKSEATDTAKSEKPKTETAAAPSTPAASSNTTGS